MFQQVTQKKSTTDTKCTKRSFSTEKGVKTSKHSRHNSNLLDVKGHNKSSKESLLENMLSPRHKENRSTGEIKSREKMML